MNTVIDGKALLKDITEAVWALQPQDSFSKAGRASQSMSPILQYL